MSGAAYCGSGVGLGRWVCCGRGSNNGTRTGSIHFHYVWRTIGRGFFWENSLTRSNNEDRHEAVRGSVHRPVPLFLSGVEPIELSIDPLGDFTREDASQQLVDHWP